MTKPIQIVLLVVVLAIVAVIGIITLNSIQEDERLTQEDGGILSNFDEYVFTTDSGDTGVLTYTSENKDSAILVINGETHQLTRARSASGARYANEDESVVFWEHQGKATIEVGADTYTTNTLEQADILTFSIAPQKVDCVGVGPMQCLVVNGELFYDTIEGFTFEEGTAYEITVARIERTNVPADASAYTYRRVEVLKSNKQGDPDANRYDFGSDGIDQDCTGGDDCEDVSALDDDSDNDSIPMDAEQSSEVALGNYEQLTAHTWVWEQTRYTDGRISEPSDSTQFVASFTEEGTFTSTTDCNNMFGSYEVMGEKLQFGPLASTKMACLGETYEAEYAQTLSAVVNVTFDANGNLLLMFNSGAMVFAPNN